MTRRRSTLAAIATAAVVVACNSTPIGPVLTDPKAIVAAALTSTQSAKSVHLDVTVDGTASVALPIGGGTGTPIDLTGTTAAADIDFARPAAHATFAAPALLGFAGELIAVDARTYLKTTLTGPLYQVSNAAAAPIDPTKAQSLIESVGELLSRPGVNLAKGTDIACGSTSCYTVTGDLTAADLGTTGSSLLSSLPVDLAGASLKLTLRVEKDLPNHLAGATAVITMPGGSALTVDLTASKWDVPVTVAAPPADKLKPASS